MANKAASGCIAMIIPNKVAIPFSETDFEKRTKSTVKNLMEVLKEHIESFKVTVVGIDEIPSKYCAYMPLKSTQKDKALKMMENFPILNSVLVKNKIELDDGKKLKETRFV